MEKGVLKWKMTNNGCKLKRENFGPVLNDVIRTTCHKQMFINGFRKCGLFPFHADAFDR